MTYTALALCGIAFLFFLGFADPARLLAGWLVIYWMLAPIEKD